MVKSDKKTPTKSREIDHAEMTALTDDLHHGQDLLAEYLLKDLEDGTHRLRDAVRRLEAEPKKKE